MRRRDFNRSLFALLTVGSLPHLEGCAAVPFHINFADEYIPSTDVADKFTPEIRGQLLVETFSLFTRQLGHEKRSGTWEVGECQGGRIDETFQMALKRAKATSQLRDNFLSPYFGPAISPVVEVANFHTEWDPPGFVCQYLGRPGEVSAILVRSPDQNKVYLVPGTSVPYVVSYKYCVGRPVSDPWPSKCSTCGTLLVLQKFERTQDGTEVFFAPRETPDQARAHMVQFNKATIKDPRIMEHARGTDLSTDCAPLKIKDMPASGPKQRICPENRGVEATDKEVQ